MTWECPRCGSVYPDSDGGLPEDLDADEKDGCLMCIDDPDRCYREDGSHRETYADESPRGEQYPDDRTELGYVYDGLSLRAVLYDEREVKRYREETGLTVSLTPAGEARCEKGGEAA